MENEKGCPNRAAFFLDTKSGNSYDLVLGTKALLGLSHLMLMEYAQQSIKHSTNKTQISRKVMR